MFKEISEEFVVRTLQNYAIYTDTNRNEVRRLYSQLATKQTWENREDIIKAVSLGKGAGEVIATHSNIVKDLSYIYERFHDLYMEDLRNTRIRIRHVGEIQETMDRIEACYKALSPSEEYIILYVPVRSERDVFCWSDRGREKAEYVGTDNQETKKKGNRKDYEDVLFRSDEHGNAAEQRIYGINGGMRYERV